MKTITRILIILSAALVVVGVTIAVTDSSSTAQAAPNFQEGQPLQLSDQAFVPGQRPEGGPDGERGSTSGWVRNLLLISAIILVIVVFERLWRRIFKPRPVAVE